MAEHRNPYPTVDIIIELDGKIVLIERKFPPHGWAIPGGFVDVGETHYTHPMLVFFRSSEPMPA